MSKSTDEMKKQIKPASIWRKPWLYLGILVVLLVAAFGLYQVPAIQNRVDSLYSKIYYRLNPPTENVFDPSQQGTLSAHVVATLTAMAPTPTTPPPATAASPTQEGAPTEMPTPTFTPFPVPAAYALDGIGLEYQTFNNCGPANLSMNITYWGWTTNQSITEDALKTHPDDRNVMLSEMKVYAEANTDLKGLIRFGGDMEVIKRLLSGGFPVLLERGHTDPEDGWMGHYSIITAYDDATRTVTIPDTLLGMMTMSYDDLLLDWSHFDGIYLVVYPPEKEQEVLSLLGEHADPAKNLRLTLEQIEERAAGLTGRELFFALYSKGSILVEMQDYLSASQAYDQAFAVYGQLDPGQRPWRILWYQVGAYPAYYYTGRFEDVVTLAQQTLDNSRQPKSLPETWYWAGKGAAALGDNTKAEEYLRGALQFYPNWDLATEELARIDVTP